MATRAYRHLTRRAVDEESRVRDAELVVQRHTVVAPYLIARRQVGQWAVEQPGGVDVPRACVSGRYDISSGRCGEDEVEDGRESDRQVGVDSPERTSRHSSRSTALHGPTSEQAHGCGFIADRLLRVQSKSEYRR